MATLCCCCSHKILCKHVHQCVRFVNFNPFPIKIFLQSVNLKWVCRICRWSLHLRRASTAFATSAVKPTVKMESLMPKSRRKIRFLWVFFTTQIAPHFKEGNCFDACLFKLGSISKNFSFVSYLTSTSKSIFE